MLEGLTADHDARREAGGWSVVWLRAGGDLRYGSSRATLGGLTGRGVWCNMGLGD